MNIIKKTLLILILLFLSLTIISLWFYPEFWGSKYLGNNFYAMDWDGNTKIIVYNDKSLTRAVFSGAYIIPDPNNKNNRYGVEIKDIKFNDRWIIVKTKNSTNIESFFLIDKNFNIKGLDWQKDNCDSIIQLHITHCKDLNSFYRYLTDKKINLKF